MGKRLNSKEHPYDFLTGLPSMSHFFEYADTAKNEILQKGELPVLMLMDFSGMKYFNIKYGYAEGDKLLKAFAEVLGWMFGVENCCRISGDHFVVITEEIDLEDRLQEMFLECRKMNNGKNLPVHVGIYPSRQENIHISIACDRARLAAAALKGMYASAFNYYSQEENDDKERKRAIIENFDRAIEEQWIQVYYQPIVRAVTEQVCDEEALARWIDPIHGFLSPAEFIPALEEAGLIHRLDLYILDQVLEKMRSKEAAGFPVVPHSINLSRVDFEYCDIVEEIRSRVDASGYSRSLITIEITESTIGSNFDFMKEQIERFQNYGFQVWIDDFGSGYSSLDFLQDIKFDVIKFDMSFMKKLEESQSAKIILTELLKMAFALGVETVCEGVESVEQVHFLQEAGCSKLQGYYYCRPIPLETIFERYEKGIQIGFENPAESGYFELLGQINLYDLTVIASPEDVSLQNAFNTLPMGIIEIMDQQARFVRTNTSYRDFFERFFHHTISHNGTTYTDFHSPFVQNIVNNCLEDGQKTLFDETMPDGSVIHSIARRIGVNPVSGSIAVAVAVLTITKQMEDVSYADIARALAADYHHIFVVDQSTDRFIEYKSQVGENLLAEERHGTDFYEYTRRSAAKYIHPDDLKKIRSWFSKDKILRDLDEQGALTATLRSIDSGTWMYVSMKITRLNPEGNRIILGFSNIDFQKNQERQLETIRKERALLTKIMALSEGYISLYSVDPVSGHYIEYSASASYESFGFAKEGPDFFREGSIAGNKVVCPEDLPAFLEQFTLENVLREIRENEVFKMHYRLIIDGTPTPVSLKIVMVQGPEGDELIAGVRRWTIRKS